MKKKRQEKLKHIIEEYEMETQEDLADRLREAGFEVTQATVSRDIRELKLTKAPAGAGKQKYVLLPKPDSSMGERYVRVLKDGFLSAAAAQNILVIKTVSGMAMAVAAALDALKLPEIAGSIAGDDTVMAVAGSAEEALKVRDKIEGMVEEC